MDLILIFFFILIGIILNSLKMRKELPQEEDSLQDIISKPVDINDKKDREKEKRIFHKNETLAFKDNENHVKEEEFTYKKNKSQKEILNKRIQEGFIISIILERPKAYKFIKDPRSLR